MAVESYEKGEKQKCPICGAPYYAECIHMKHPEKIAEIKGKPTKIQLGTEGPETEEALAVHKELVDKIIPGEITAEELRSDEIEAALEKLTEDEKNLVEEVIDEVIKENEKDPAVAAFLKFETEQASRPKETRRIQPIRASLIDTTLITLEQRKKLFKDPKALKESLKKSVINKIRNRYEAHQYGRIRF